MTRTVKIAKVMDQTGATTHEARNALDDCGWDIVAAVDLIRRKMPIKRGAS